MIWMCVYDLHRVALFFFFYSLVIKIVILKCSEKVAVQALKASDWHLEGAFDAFYSQPQSRTYTDSRHLEELYNRYKGEQYLSTYFSL